MFFFDLVASKHIYTIKLSPAYINTFEFNPCDLSLAASTSGRYVKLWDIDSRSPIFSSPPESCQIGGLAYSKSGLNLYTTTKNGFKKWDTTGDGCRLEQTVEVGWSNIADMKVAENDQIIAASFLSNFVSVWVVDINSSSDDENADNNAARKDEYLSAPITSVSPGPVTTNFVSRATAKDSKSDDYKDDADSKMEARNSKVSQAKGDSDSSDEKFSRDYRDNDEKQDPAVYSEDPSRSQDMATSLGESFWKRYTSKINNADDPIENSVDEVLEVPHNELESLLPPSSFDPPAAATRLPKQPPSIVSVKPEPIKTMVGGNVLPSDVGVSKITPKTPSVRDMYPQPVLESRDPVNKPRLKERYSNGGGDDDAGEDKISPLEVVGARHQRDDNTNIPSSKVSSRPNTSSTSSTGQEATKCHELADILLSSSSVAKSTLSQRLVTLKLLRQNWSKGNIIDVLETLQVLSDAMKMNNSQNINIITDFLSGIELKSQNMSLDDCTKLLPIIDDVLSYSNTAPPSEVVTASCYGALIGLAQCFGELIHNTRSVMVTGGVDLSREERLSKCSVCHTVFSRAKQRIETIRHQYRNSRKMVDLLEQYQRLATQYF